MDPKRFLDGDDDAFETRLVRAARRDAAPDGAAQRAAVALGVGAGSAALSSGAGASGLGGLPGTAAASAKMGLLGIGKWFGIGIVSGVIATTGFHYVTRPASVSRDAPPATSALEAARPPRPMPVAAAPVVVAEAPTPEAPTLDEAIEPSAKPAKKSAAPSSSGPKATARAEGSAGADPATPADSEAHLASLAAELALLQEARKALVAHDPARVLAALQRYSSTPRSGLLDSEADVLRVEALVQAGRQPEAMSLAASALRAAPEGPHAARFRRILGAAAPSP